MHFLIHAAQSLFYFSQNVVHIIIFFYGSLVTLLKFQMALKLTLLISSGSKKKEPRYACLSEANASHSRRMSAKFSASAPHLLHSRLSSSPCS